MPKNPAAGVVKTPAVSSGQSSRLRVERLDLLVATAQELTAQARLFEARDMLLDVIERDPKNDGAYLSLAVVYENLGMTENSMATFHKACEVSPDNPLLVSASVFACDRSPETTLEDGYRVRQRFAELITKQTPPMLEHRNVPAPDRKLRVGFVSGDMRHHSAAKVFGVPLLKIDREQFDVAVYMTLAGEDWMTETLRAGVGHWRDASTWSNDRLFEQIRSDQIDILVDLSGHSAGNRLPVFARKPAPVQVTAWGYITGTGLPQVDYMLADAVTVRPDEERWFAERIYRLPNIVSFWATDPEIIGPVKPLPCLKNGHLTFGSLNRLGKLKIQTLEIWARILQALPDAKLIIKCHGLEHAEIRLMVQQRFEQFGTNLGQLQFRGASDGIEHQKTFNEIDVALDPWPDGGGVSTLEGLWMGVPAITLPYHQIASRLTTSFQKELGLDWFSASSADEYVERAVQLNSQRQELARVRRWLRDTMCISALCNTNLYVNAVGDALREMWRRYCAERNGMAGPDGRPQITLVGA